MPSARAVEGVLALNLGPFIDEGREVTAFGRSLAFPPPHRAGPREPGYLCPVINAARVSSTR